MRILLFGGSGQLGYELISKSRDLHFDLFYPVTKELDITDEKQVFNLITKLQPEVVINSAAYTLVDLAETEKARADEVNAIAPENIAKACKVSGSYFIHVSTDYVFDGSKNQHYVETDQTNPVNYYGESKLKGENNIAKIFDNYSILRTSSLHGQKGVNFVHTMLKLFKDKKTVKVVNDQIMCPTHAGWLAETIIDFARIKPKGLFHASGKGECSWFEFASEILRQTNSHFPDAVVEPCSSLEFVRPAKRPEYSVMDCAKLNKVLNRENITWQEGLTNHLTEIGYI